MALLASVTAESRVLLTAVKDVAADELNLDQLTEAAKVLTESTQRICNLLTTGSADVSEPISPRADSPAGQLKALAAKIIRARRDAQAKGDGMNAMRDLEVVEKTQSGIANVIKDILYEAEHNPPSLSAASEPVSYPPAPVESTPAAEPIPEPVAVPPPAAVSPPPPAPAAAPAPAPAPAAAPAPAPAPAPVEEAPVVLTLASPRSVPKATPVADDNVTVSLSSPDMPEWKRKLLARKKALSEDMTPAKGSSASSSPAKTSSPAPAKTVSSAAARWETMASASSTPTKSATPAATSTPTKVETKVEPPVEIKLEPKVEPTPVKTTTTPAKVTTSTASTTTTPSKKEEPKKVVNTLLFEEKKEEKKPVAVSDGFKSTQSSAPAAKPTSAKKINSSGTALDTTLQRHVNNMAGVKTLSVSLNASPTAIDKCNEARAPGSSTRYVVLKVEREKLELVSVGDATSSIAADFESMPRNIDVEQAAFVFFRYRDGGEKDWALISWLPSKTPVKSKTLYASSVETTSVLMGANRVSKTSTFNTVWVFADFHQEETPLKNKDDFLAEENDAVLPFSEMELAKRQVEREERQARKELGSTAKEASGFHTVAFPLEADAVDAIQQLRDGSHTWVQLSLDDAGKKIQLKGKGSPAAVTELPALIVATEPQFYVYMYKEGIPILIYFCPDSGVPIKRKMMYPTCKSALADTILSYGYSDIKKLDIRNTGDLTASELDDAYDRKTGFIPSSAAGESTTLAAPVKTGPARYGAQMGGLGGLGALVAGRAKKQ